jgi:hypothetical protein
VPVALTIQNDTNTDKVVPVTYTLYEWDQQHPDNQIDQRVETVTIPANSSLEVTYSAIAVGEASAYLLVAKTDTHSVANIRFVREGVPATRLNFPALTSFPLTANTPTTLFSCVHAAGTMDIVENSKLTLTLTDNITNETLHTYTYTGGVTGAMMAVKDDYVPTERHTDVTLTAELYRDDNLVEREDMRYSCETIEGMDCPPPVVDESESKSLSLSNILMLVGLVLFALIGMGLWIRHSRSGGDDGNEPFITPTSGGPTTLSVLFLLALSAAVSVPTSGEAASVTVNKTVSGIYAYQGTNSNSASAWRKGLENPTISVGYTAQVYKNGSPMPQSGGSVAVGDQICVAPNLGSISYYGTGYTGDTPPGSWVQYAGWPTASPGTRQWCLNGTCITVKSGTCNQGYLGNIQNYAHLGEYYDVYAPLSVHPQNAITEWTGTTAGLSHEGGGCYRVTSGGNIQLKIRFPQTYAKFYYEYSTSLNGYGCARSWNEYPMFLAQEVQKWGIITYGGSPQWYTTLDLSNPNTNYSTTIPEASISYSMTATHPAIGNFDGTDSVNCKVNGWAYDPDSSSASIDVHVYRDASAFAGGTFVAGCTANLSRPDVNTAYGIGGTHGFSCDLGAGYRDGVYHNLYIHAIDVDGTPNNVLSNSPRGLSCAPPATCGTAHNTNSYTAPTANFCINGTMAWTDSVAADNNWNWTCTGGGATRSCLTNKKVDNYCGTADGFTSYSRPTINLCAINNVTWTDTTAADYTWNWTCNGINGGTSDSCITNRRADGVCDANRNTSFYSTILNWQGGSSYCSVGSPSDTPAFPVPGTSVSWICSGINGGNPANCGAYRMTEPNLKPGPNVSFTPSVGYDVVTGIYNYLSMSYSVQNTGETPAGSFTNHFNTTVDQYYDGEVYNHNSSRSMSGLAGLGSRADSVVLGDDIPFGNVAMSSSVDYGNNVDESNEVDNIESTTYTLLPLDPGMTIDAPDLVRSDNTFEISYDTVAQYYLECRVEGGGLSNVHTFNPRLDGTTGTLTFGPITNKSMIVLTCVEPTTNTTFTASDTVEVVSSFEER